MRILVLLLLIFSTSSALYAEEVIPANPSDYVLAANRKHRELCKSLRANFKFDSLFSDFIYNRCNNFDGDKYKLEYAIYRYPNKYIPDYNKNHKNLVANFILNMNKDEEAYLKKVVTEYCTYNSHLYRKKNPQACTQETIEALFQTMP